MKTAIGGGVMGTSIAFNLARRGFGRVVLLEQNTICSGTSGKSSAVVRTRYTTRPTARMALEVHVTQPSHRSDVMDGEADEPPREPALDEGGGG